MSELPAFETFEFRNELNQALSSLGFDQPTPIQAQAIGPILAGEHVIGQAQTGTGKTAAFVLPILQRIDTTSKATQALIIAPTRELAAQIADSATTLGAQIKGLNIVTVYGGQSYPMQKRALKQGAHIVVATPGRLIDLLDQGAVKTDTLRMLVLDEADEMLSMGFIEDIETIFNQAPDDCQRTLFSATLSPQVLKIANRHLTDPKQIRIGGNTQQSAEQIKQFYVRVKANQRVLALSQLLELQAVDGAIVFVKTKQQTSEVADELELAGIKAEAINGDMPQNLRELTVERLRSGLIDVLVATDVVARGLDVERISHVFNLDLPTNHDTYIHRVGRTGRAGRKGTAISIIGSSQMRILSQIERHSGREIVELERPTAQKLRDHRIGKVYESVFAANNQKTDSATQKTVLDLTRQILGAMEPEEAVSALINAWQGEQLNRITELDSLRPEHKKAARSERSSPAKDNNGRRREGNVIYVPYRLGIGRSQGLSPGNVVGALVNEGGLEPGDVGGIRVRDDHAIVELNSTLKLSEIGKLSKIRLKRRALNLIPFSERAPKPEHSKYQAKEKAPQKRVRFKASA
ncbi:MAG: DEAD/DEAH box helicase [Gammaproteobacteria bacterium]|nr:DEAD/DEAH box helicase [Gammaproteobacteria bacterium]